MQCLPAGREHLDARTSLQHLPGERGRGREQMFAVVQQEEHLAFVQEPQDAIGPRPPRLLSDPQRRRHRLRHQLRLAQPGEIHDPCAVSEGVCLFGGKLQREPGLADPARTSQREQPGTAEQAGQLGEFLFASDQARWQSGQVVRQHIERPERRKLRVQLRMEHLQQSHRDRQVPQPVLAEVEERHIRHRAEREPSVCRVGHQHLTAVRDSHDPCAPVHRDTVVVAVLGLRGLHLGADGVHRLAHGGSER